MKVDFLPLIALPNDSNESDISLLLSSGEIIRASEAIKRYPLLKELVQNKIKLMADEPNATVDTPQVWPVTVAGQNFVSLSFYCSVDNYNRKTSTSIVFAEGQQKKFEALITAAPLPESLMLISDQMRKIVNNFSFLKYLNSDVENSDVKKKSFWLIVSGVIFVILLLIYLQK